MENFEFEERNKPINWERLRTLNIERYCSITVFLLL